MEARGSVILGKSTGWHVGRALNDLCAKAAAPACATQPAGAGTACGMTNGGFGSLFGNVEAPARSVCGHQWSNGGRAPMGAKAVCCLLPGEPDNEGLNPAPA